MNDKLFFVKVFTPYFDEVIRGWLPSKYMARILCKALSCSCLVEVSACGFATNHKSDFTRIDTAITQYELDNYV